MFHVVADGAQPGSTSKPSPSRLTMHVPLAALPSPVASDVTLRIPKACFGNKSRQHGCSFAANIISEIWTVVLIVHVNC